MFETHTHSLSLSLTHTHTHKVSPFRSPNQVTKQIGYLVVNQKTIFCYSLYCLTAVIDDPIVLFVSFYNTLGCCVVRLWSNIGAGPSQGTNSRIHPEFLHFFYHVPNVSAVRVSIIGPGQDILRQPRQKMRRAYIASREFLVTCTFQV